MKSFSELKRLVSLNRDFFLKLKEYPAVLNGLKSKRFWFYAESLGEFRLALDVADIIKSILYEKKECPPIIFISFKTFSTLTLAEKYKNTGILFFHHPFLILKPVLKRYVSAMKPDYFISVQHPVPKKLIKELLFSGIGAGLIFLGINAAGLKKMLKMQIDERLVNASGSSLFAEVSGSDGKTETKISVPPCSLKFISCGSKKISNKNKAERTGNNVVISFVSIHEKEAFFILKLIGELIAESNLIVTAVPKNLKFILVPRNIKNLRKLSKAVCKAGFNMAYYGNNREKFPDGNHLNNPAEFLNNAGMKIMIVDKYGVLDEIYPYSDIVYVGKSLFKGEEGGHNVLEPASFGKPVITGEYAANFADITGEMVKCSAGAVTSKKNFKDVLIEFIKDENLREKTGENALNFCLAKNAELKKYLKNYLSGIIFAD